VACLYCGKEIGPLQLFRDDEFCSPAHRKRYAERLGKVIGRIGESEPVPARTADFRGKFEPFAGDHQPRLQEWMPIPLQDPRSAEPRLQNSWPLEITPLLGAGLLRSVWPQVALPSSRPSRKYSAEFPVFQSVIFDLEPPAPAPGLPGFREFRLPREATPPPPVESWMAISETQTTAPDPLPVGEPAPVAPQWPATPAFGLTTSQTCGLAPHSGYLTQAPSPMLKTGQTAAETAPASLDAQPLQVPDFDLTPSRHAAPAMFAEWLGGVPAPAEANLAAAPAAEAIPVESIDVRLPAFTFDATTLGRAAWSSTLSSAICRRSEPLPPNSRLQHTGAVERETPAASLPALALGIVETDLFDAVPAPARCEELAAPPASEPASRPTVPAGPIPQPLLAELRAQLPVLPAFAPRVPAIATVAGWAEHRIPDAAAGPRHPASEPLPAGFTPVLAAALPLVAPAAALSARCPAAAPAALAPRAATRVAKTTAVVTPCRFPAPAISTLPLAAAINGPQLPDEPPAWLAPHYAQPPRPMRVLAPAASFRDDIVLPEFALTARHEFSIAGFGPPQPVASPPDPQELNDNAAVLVPISWIRVQAPPTSGRRVMAQIPEPGFIPVDFYCQRAASAPARHGEWLTPNIPVRPPELVLRVLPDRPEEMVALPPQVEPKPAPAEVFSFPEAKKRWKPSKAEKRFARIAACLLAAIWLWFGSQVINIPNTWRSMNRSISEAPGQVAPGAGSFGGSGSRPVPTQSAGAEPPASAPASEGAFGRMRRAIAGRAATEVTDTFRNGMEAWGSGAGSFAPGWSRSSEGYTKLGQLALFQPSMNYTDYRVQFFSAIDDKGMGVALRAKDTQNYYAMKVKVVQAGLRPVIAMVHYPVVEGRRGRPNETPLNVMVHHLPFEIAFDVHGNRVTAMVEGEKVESWTDELLAKGGVGFFTEGGERARLYWMKISRNQDWLGHICAFATGTTTETAELWGPGLPEDSGPPAPAEHKHEIYLAGLTWRRHSCLPRPDSSGRPARIETTLGEIPTGPRAPISQGRYPLWS
jgi:hypothetical protein